jgi:PAS domain S-box-containing protein
MVALWDLDLKNIFANRAYVSFFGKAPEQIRGRHIFELLGPELYARNEPFMRRALAGESVSFERDIPTREGVRHTHAAYMPMWDASKIAGMFVFVTDNSELKQAQMKLTTILDSTVEVGIISLDMTGRIWVFSKGAELLLDVSSEKILGTQNLRRFFDGDELKAQQAELGIDESDESYAGPHRQDQFWCFFRYDHASLSRAV